ncbi:MAG: hypothetical protein K940chlam3_00427 [Chlamydiae bacterium]|nr:hypothetical protein [Chlamydiota bacterium]
MKVLVISFSDLARDPRVARQLQWLLQMDCSITVLSYGQTNQPIDQQFSFSPFQRTGFDSFKQKIFNACVLLKKDYERFYWTRPEVQFFEDILKNRLNKTYDLIIANDFNTLPLIARYKRGSKVLLDAHEYTPEEFTDNLKWRIFFQNYCFETCRKYLPYVDTMMTVNAEIANQYAEVFKIPLPFVLTNATSYYPMAPSKVAEDKIRLIHHGVASRSRSFDRMIRMFDHLDERFYLDLIMVPGDKKYIEKIKRLVKKYPRIRCIPPVPMNEIVPFTNQYDIGVYLLPPVNFNYLNGLPNKLFEFIQARLAIAIGPSPAMKRLVTQYDCGVVSSDFQAKSLAVLLNALTRKDIVKMKKNAHFAAKEQNADVNKDIIKQAIKEALMS